MSETIRGDWRLNVAALAVLSIWSIKSAVNASTGGAVLGSCVFAAVTGVIGIRLAMVRIVLSPEGVRMCGFVRSQFFAWAEVAEFDTVQQWVGHTPRCVVLRTTSGQTWSSISLHVARDEAEAILHQIRDAKIRVIGSVYGECQE